MTRKKKPAPSPRELEAAIAQLVRDALAVVMPYRILHKKAYDSSGSASAVRISGGSESNPVEDALSSKSQETLRSFATSIADRIGEAGRQLDNARTDVGKVVGRQFRQPTKPGPKSIVDGSELQAAVDRRRARFARGEE